MLIYSWAWTKSINGRGKIVESRLIESRVSVLVSKRYVYVPFQPDLIYLSKFQQPKVLSLQWAGFCNG